MIQKRRILIFERSNAKQFPGGDTIQIYEMAEYLKKNNYDIRVTSDLTTDLTNFDVIFILNLQLPDEAYQQAKLAFESNKPYLFFPIYWDLDSLNMKDVFSVKCLVKRIFSSKLKGQIRSIRYRLKHKSVIRYSEIGSLPRLDQMISYILGHATFICPNSKAELQHLIKKFPGDAIVAKSVVIYNGFDEKKLQLKELNLSHLSLPDSYVCCIGAIGPRKNQLNLIRAANLLGIPLVIVGKVSSGSEAYGQYVRRKAKENVRFIDYCEQDIVFQIMKKSNGHIQPSYIETPGLVSLEAAALGCGIAVSDTGPVKEYFGDKALYVDPYDYKSIAVGMEKLYNNESLNHSDYYKSQFNWNITLSKLHELLEAL